MTPSELIDLIIDRAPKLRAAGVRTLQLPDAICVTFDAPDPPVVTAADVARAIEADEEPSDPLSDPATYGRKSGTPGFDISDLDESDEP